MTAATVSTGLIAAGHRAARQAVAARRAELITAAAVGLAGIDAAATPDGVALTAPGLRARAFGTRTSVRDVRLIAFVEEHR